MLSKKDSQKEWFLVAITFILIALVAVVMFQNNSTAMVTRNYQGSGTQVTTPLGDIPPQLMEEPAIATMIEPDLELHLIRCQDPNCINTPSITPLFLGLGPYDPFRSIKLRDNGNPVILYDKPDNTVLLDCHDPLCNTYTQTDIPEVLGRDNVKSFIIPSDNKPFIVIGERSGAFPPITSLKTIKCGNPTCSSGNVVTTIYQIISLIYFPSDIQIGSDGFPRIVWVNPSSGSENSLRFVQCLNSACSSFQEKILESGSPSTFLIEYSSVAFDTTSDGIPTIVYLVSNSSLTNAVRIFSCLDPDCANGGSAQSLNIEVDRRANIIIPEDDLPVITFGTRNSSPRMTLIKCGGAACNPLFNSNPIIFGNYVRGHASLISPTTGLPLIFYQMRPAQPPYSLQLRVARCQDPACTTRSESILDDNTTIYRIGADN